MLAAVLRVRHYAVRNARNGLLEYRLGAKRAPMVVLIDGRRPLIRSGDSACALARAEVRFVGRAGSGKGAVQPLAMYRTATPSPYLPDRDFPTAGSKLAVCSFGNWYSHRQARDSPGTPIGLDRRFLCPTWRFGLGTVSSSARPPARSTTLRPRLPRPAPARGSVRCDTCVEHSCLT
jgi:hypothetical protein